MDWQPRLDGERLRLRPLEPGDREALYAAASDPLIWEQHPIDTRWRADVFDAYFRHLLDENDALVAIDKADDTVIGSSSYSNYRPENGGAVEIGSTFLARSHWGGPANREMKALMVAHALEDVARVEFLIGETNWRSRKAMEKIGGILTDRLHHAEHEGRQILHLIYEIDRAGFAAGPLA